MSIRSWCISNREIKNVLKPLFDAVKATFAIIYEIFSQKNVICVLSSFLNSLFASLDAHTGIIVSNRVLCMADFMKNIVLFINTS